MAEKKFSVDQWLADYLIPANGGTHAADSMTIPRPLSTHVTLAVSDGNAKAYVSLSKDLLRESLGDGVHLLLKMLDDAIVKLYMDEHNG